MKLLGALSTAGLLTALAACDSGPKSGRGFRLPDGDSEKGKAAFVQLECNVCHKVSGVDLPPPSTTSPVAVTVELGGKVYNVRTYGQLVTSVINPSHTLVRGYKKEQISRDGESRMANYNAVMTVDQLIDLVAFLQSRYELLEPEYVPY